MKSESNKDGKPQKFLDRDDLLEKSSILVESLHKRISAKRFRAKGTDAAKLSYARALIQALTAHNGILKDKEIDNVIKRLEALENGGNHDK